MANAEAPPPSPIPSSPPFSLLQPPSQRKRQPRHHRHTTKLLRAFRSAFRSLPIIAPTACNNRRPLPLLDHNPRHHHNNHHRYITGTLYGPRKGRVTLSVQENPRTLPALVVELAIPTHQLQREMSIGMVRIAMECEKRSEKDRTPLTQEPLWTVYCNGKKSGYGVRREATSEDLGVMEMLRAISMGAGVLPPTDGEEVTYMRARFEKVVGSRDSETLYMMSPEGANNNNGPELSIFFVRI